MIDAIVWMGPGASWPVALIASLFWGLLVLAIFAGPLLVLGWLYVKKDSKLNGVNPPVLRSNVKVLRDAYDWSNE